MTKFVFFDLDGTLTDPFEGITGSILYALGKMGRELPERDSLRSFIGPPLIPSFRTFLGMTQAEAERALGLYREYYAEHGLFENRVYPGIPALLDRLKRAGRILCLATSKPETFARRILEHFSLDGYFREICGATLDGSRETKGEVLKELVRRLSAARAFPNASRVSGPVRKNVSARPDPKRFRSVPPLPETKLSPALSEEVLSAAVMIGDRKHDAEGAREIGIPTVGVLWGYGSREELDGAGCVKLAESPEELV